MRPTTLIVLAALVTACSDSTRSTAPEVLSSLSVTPAHDSIQEGNTVGLIVKPVDQNGVAISGIDMSWSSSDTTIARVDSTKGVVTAVAAGAATITVAATQYGRSAAVAIIVTPAPPVLTTITVDPSTTSLQAGSSVQLAAAALDQKGRTFTGAGTATWSSSDTALATVSAAGIVTGQSAGEVSISASFTGGAVTKTGTSRITVTPAPAVLTSLSVSASSALVQPTKTISVTAVPLDQYGVTMNGLGSASWTSSDPTIATVDPVTGVVTGVSAGTVTITGSLTVNGVTKTGSSSVTVQVLKSVTIAPSASTISLGQTVQLTATGLDQNGTPITSGLTITWGVNSGGKGATIYATVSKTGLATGVISGGTSSIAAILVQAAGGVQKTALASVTVK